MKQVKSWLLALIFAVSVGGTGIAVVSPQVASAASKCEPSFLGFPPWYRGLTDDKCNIKSPGSDIQGFALKVSLNILDIILRLVGFLAVGFVIFGGFKYITSTGSTDGMAKAKSTIMNALIGLGLSIASVGIVNAVAGSIDGGTENKGGVNNLPTQSADTVLQGVLGAVYFWGGIACVIVIVIAGFYYVTSQGNASQVARAKSAIIAAIVGLVVILMAFAITQFVIGGII